MSPRGSHDLAGVASGSVAEIMIWWIIPADSALLQYQKRDNALIWSLETVKSICGELIYLWDGYPAAAELAAAFPVNGWVNGYPSIANPVLKI